jgi:hypothetical protein
MAMTATTEAPPDKKGITRRAVMKKGAIVGGALLWAAPAIQTIDMKAALAATFTCCACTLNGTEKGKQKCDKPDRDCAGTGNLGSTVTMCGTTPPTTGCSDCCSFCKGLGLDYCFSTNTTQYTCASCVNTGGGSNCNAGTKTKCDC